MTRSDDDAGVTARKGELVEPDGDAALEDFLLRVQELGAGPVPAPNARLAALLGAPAPARVRRIAPRTVAGATALGVATLVGTGWAAAAADQLPAPAQRAVARLTAGWLPGIPHPEEQRTGAGSTPSAVLPTPTTTTLAVPTGEDPTGDGAPRPVRQSVAPVRPTGTRGEDTESSDGGDRGGSGSSDRAGEGEESGNPGPSGTRTTSDDSRDDDGGTGGDSHAGATGGSTGGSTGEAGDGATDTHDDGDGTGSGDGRDASGTSTGGADSDG